jgi:integrase
MRRRELSDLGWSDLDLARGTVTLQQRAAQHRTLDLGSATVAALRRLAMRQIVDRSTAGDTWIGGIPGSTGWVLASRIGGPCSPVVLTRAFHRVQTDLDLPRIPFHGLRHTALRIAAVSGATVHAIAERFGHLDTASVLETWGHLLDVPNDEPEAGQG